MPEGTKRPPLRGDRNQCPTCSALFNSTRAFAAHRVRVTPAAAYPRRCLTPEEMEAKGMAVNRGGFWLTEPHPLRRVAP